MIFTSQYLTSNAPTFFYYSWKYKGQIQFIFPKVNGQLFIYKPVTYIGEISVEFLFYSFQIFMLIYQTCITYVQRYKSQSAASGIINLFSTNVPLMDKPGSWFLLKMALFHRCFQTFCWQKPTTWFLHKQNIGRKWVNTH